MRKKRKIKWKKGLAVVLATTVTAVSTVSGNGKSIFTVYAATEESEAIEGTKENTSINILDVTTKGAISCGTDENGPKYTFDENGILTLQGSGEVTKDFQGYTNIKEVTAENNCAITGLSQRCFYGCSGIEKVNLSNLSRLTELPFGCFEGCTGLTGITIPENIVTLGGSCFKDCKNLQSVDIPENMIKISDYSFQNCSSLQYVNYAGSKASWEKIDGINSYASSGLNAPLINANKIYGKYTITFDVNGGDQINNDKSIEGEVSKTIKLKETDGNVAADIPSADKNGWTFIGWNTNPSAKVGLSEISINKSDIVLYAIFEKSIKATFIDADLVTDATQTLSKSIYTEGATATIEMPSLPAKEGWSAVGWSTSEDTINSIIKSGEEISISKNTTYYAVYKKNVTVTYEAGVVPNKESEQMSIAGLPKNETGIRYCIGKQFIDPSFSLLQGVSQSGYKFSYWQDKNATDTTTKKYAAGESVTIDQDKTFTAVWTIEAAATPKITVQPADVEKVYGYENAFMQIKAEIANEDNYELSYQWYEKTETDNKELVGTQTKSSQLTIPKNEYEDAGTYYFYCEVTATRKDNGEIKKVTSDVATFTVKKAERTITIGNLNKIFDNNPIADIRSKVEINGTTIQDQDILEDNYYEDNNGEIGNPLPSGTIPSKPGTYWVEVKIAADKNYKAASASKKFTISYLPTPEKPYILTIDNQEITNKEWYNKGNITILPPSNEYTIAKDSYENEFSPSIILSEGEGKHTVHFYLKNIAAGTITNKISIPINIDTTNPKGVIQVKDKTWKDLQESITFEEFFKGTQYVTISGEDQGSGLDSIYYLLSSNEMTEEDLKKRDDWIKYTLGSSVPLNLDGKYIIYAKIIDKAGNIGYCSSNGIVFDNTAPVIKGIVDHQTYYYGDITFEIEDNNEIESIQFGGADLIAGQFDSNNEYTFTTSNGPCIIKKEPQKYKYTIKAAEANGNYGITVKDKAGNITVIQQIFIYNKYKVTFKNVDVNNPDLMTIYDTKTVNYNEQVSKPATPTREGYVFAGWAESGNNSNFDFSTPIKKNLELVAKWTPASYQITFDSQDGSFCNPITATYQQAVGVMPIPTLAGHRFLGWYTSLDDTAQTGTKIENNTVFNFTENITLYARWEKMTYNVKFESEKGILDASDALQGGSYNTSTHILQVTYGEQYGYLPKATRGGYKFLGWYTDKISGNKVEPSTIYNNTDSITLYAHWQEATLDVALNYNYNYNGGHIPSGTNEPSEKTIQVVYHDTYDVLRGENPTRDGYTFDGWYTEQTGGRKIEPTEKVIIVNNTTFYAHWTPKNYTLSFNSNGGSACEKKVVTYGEKYNNLPTPEKHGYNFNKWHIQTEEGNPITNNDYIEITSDTTLVATWNACESDVTLDSNGGSFQGENKQTIKVIYDKTYLDCGLDQKVPTRTGYEFKGWYRNTDDNKKIKIENDSKVDITEPTTFYADWTANPYKVIFNGNAENSVINPPENVDSDIYDIAGNTLKVTYEQEYGTLPTAKRTGYTFTGWYTELNEGQGTQITETSIHDTTGDRTFYAHWTANNYTVTFDKNTGDTIIPPENVNSDIYDMARNTLKVTYNAASYGTLPTAQKAGYTFAGWYTEAKGGTEIKASDSVNITKDTTFYAHWTVNNLTFEPQKLDPARYKGQYSQELNKPNGGTGEYQYELAENSSLPKGLKLIENRIEGSLEEDVNKGPFTFKIKITDKNSKAFMEQEFTIVSQKGTPEQPQSPQVLSKTSHSVTLKEIEGAVYCAVKDNEAIPTDIKDWKTSPTINDLEKGTTYNFYVKLVENGNYIESSVSEPTKIKTLDIYDITLPEETEKNHYKITPVQEKSEGWLGENKIEEGGSYSFKIEFADGYNKTLDFAVYATTNVNGTEKKQKITVDSEGLYTIKNIIENKTIVVEGVGDSIYPTGTIEIEGTDGNSWHSFEKNITYSKFYNKNTIPVKIQGNDAEEGIKSISYYVGTEKEIFTELQIYAGKDNFNWKESSPSTTGTKAHTVSVNLEIKEGKLVIYAKIEDNGGNITYLRSQGIIIDTVSPTIQPVSDSEMKITGDGSTGTTIYETTNKEVPFLIQDEYLKDVTMDGKPFQPFGGKYFVPADGKEHTIVARDEAGNETTHKVQVKVKECTVTFHSEGNSDSTIKVAYNQTVTKPADPQKEGSIFYGWFLDGVEFDFNKPIQKDIELIGKWLETGNTSITGPEKLQVSATQVVLKQEKGYKYCMNDGEPTETPVFKGLTPGKEYCFYKIDEKGNKSAPLKITTETTAATGMMALPSTLYQGEAYNIAPTIAMEGLVNKSADPENTTIAWVVNKPDIVSITNQSTKGCTLSINQVPYNRNRLTRVTLTATVVYSEMNQGNLVSKTRSYKKSFNVQNLSKDVSIDLSGFSTEPTDVGAFVSGSAICLMDKKGVSLKTAINLGAEGNIATNQKLKWFISDKDGKTNLKGKKIASVNSKGVIKGIRPGTTYVTVATADSYDKSTKSYKVFKTCQIICPWVKEISFDSSVEKTVQAGSTINLASVLQCNPENLFNKQKMAKRWKSSDTKVARVTSKGIVTFKKAGTVTITCTPTGGQEIDAATGKVRDTAKNMTVQITFTVQ